MLGVLPFGEDPDLWGTAGTAVPQHLPPWGVVKLVLVGGVYEPPKLEHFGLGFYPLGF